MYVTKFRCSSVSMTSTATNKFQATARLQAVADRPVGSVRRVDDAPATGSIVITVTDPAGLEMFQPGDEFYVDFTPVGDAR